MVKKLIKGLSAAGIRLLLLAWTATVVYPVIWVLMSSLKNNQEFYRSPWALPQALRLENYYTAWVTTKFAQYFTNSLGVVVFSVALTVLMASTTAYVLAKYKMRGIRLFENVYIVLMMVPQVLVLIPLFFQLNALKMVDSLPVLVLIYAVQSVPFAIFMLTGFMRGIHDSFLEAAAMDGCSEFRLFFKIVLPMVLPGVFIVAIVTFMSVWNEYVMAINFIKSEALFTVPVGIRNLAANMQYRVNFGALFAGLTIAMAPIIVIYAVFQRQLQEGLSSSSGVKG